MWPCVNYNLGPSDKNANNCTYQIGVFQGLNKTTYVKAAPSDWHTVVTLHIFLPSHLKKSVNSTQTSKSQTFRHTVTMTEKVLIRALPHLWFNISQPTYAGDTSGYYYSKILLQEKKILSSFYTCLAIWNHSSQERNAEIFSCKSVSWIKTPRLRVSFKDN